MEDAKLRPVKNGQALVQQKLPDGSEKRKGTGSWAAGYGKGKPLTLISIPSATGIVTTHMRLQLFPLKLATGR